METQNSNFLANFNEVSKKIAELCKSYNRQPKDIEVLAVSKQVESERIVAAIQGGQKIFGENYLQEAKEKWVEIRKNFPEVKLHFIGHLQSNKAKEAVALFDCIESLDGEKLAKILQKEIQQQNREIEVFLQVNLGSEPQKSGLKPEEVQDFYNFCQKEIGLKIAGFMGISPVNCHSTPYFALLTKIAYQCFFNVKNPGAINRSDFILNSGQKFPKISMGMSNDYQEAIALGATEIRLGSILFGKRN